MSGRVTEAPVSAGGDRAQQRIAIENADIGKRFGKTGQGGCGIVGQRGALQLSGLWCDLVNHHAEHIALFAAFTGRCDGDGREAVETRGQRVAGREAERATGRDRSDTLQLSSSVNLHK